MPERLYPDLVEIARGSASRPAMFATRRRWPMRSQEMIAHPGPYVLDVMIPYQEHVLPMIPAGMTVRDIIKS